MRLHERFNRSGFSRFINSPAGRALRVVAGLGFLAVGFVYRHDPLGVASLVWGLLPLSAGALDLCYVSAVLGGPVRGSAIRGGAGSGPGAGTSGTRAA